MTTDLRDCSYQEVKDFLKNNKIPPNENIEPCVPITLEEDSRDIFELFVVSIPLCEIDKLTDYLNIPYDKCYYYIFKYNNEDFKNELSVLDCGGYYIAMCIFKNKINVTNNYFYNKDIHDKYDKMTKYHINTTMKNKHNITRAN